MREKASGPDSNADPPTSPANDEATHPMNDEQRPNILLIVTDQHRADHVGFGGNPVSYTHLTLPTTPYV